MPRRIAFEQLPDLVGEEVAVSGWFELSQERIDRFAAASGDDQWIHTNPARAVAESPYGGTIAHGFLTLSLTTILARDAFEIDGARISLNYGLNRVRFPAPAHAGARLRGRFVLQACTPVEGGVQLSWGVTVEAEGGGPKPCLAAEWITRALF